MKIKAGDIIIIAICAVIAVSLWLIPSAFIKKEASPRYAVIEANGKEAYRIALPANKTEYEINGVEIIIEDCTAYVKQSDCPDKTCVKTGVLTASGERAVCLPNRVMVYLEGGKGNDTVVG